MMKWLAFILVLLLFASCSADRGAPNSLQKMGIKGNVQSLLVTEYKADRTVHTADADSVLGKSGFEFNNRGYVSSEFIWLPGGHMKWCVYKFDASLVPVMALKYNEDSSLCYKAIFSYDGLGNMMEQCQYDARDSLNLKIVYKYDKWHNKTEESSFWENAKLLNKYSYTYNEHWLVTERRFYNADSALVMRATYKYDAKGDMIEETKFGEDDEKGWVTVYKYGATDGKGNWLERTGYNSKEAVSITKRVFVYYK
jgi:hypothetical protein